MNWITPEPPIELHLDIDYDTLTHHDRVYIYKNMPTSISELENYKKSVEPEYPILYRIGTFPVVLSIRLYKFLINNF